MENIQELLTTLCRDEDLSKDHKQRILSQWKEELIQRNGNRLLDTEQMGKHVHWLEMIENAQRIVGS